jgi:hypothetical protein
VTRRLLVLAAGLLMLSTAFCPAAATWPWRAACSAAPWARRALCSYADWGNAHQRVVWAEGMVLGPADALLVLLVAAWFARREVRLRRYERANRLARALEDRQLELVQARRRVLDAPPADIYRALLQRRDCFVGVERLLEQFDDQDQEDARPASTTPSSADQEDPQWPSSLAARPGGTQETP